MRRRNPIDRQGRLSRMPVKGEVYLHSTSGKRVQITEVDSATEDIAYKREAGGRGQIFWFNFRKRYQLAATQKLHP